MPSVGSGHTALSDPRAAAAQLVEQAKGQVTGKPTLAILLATVDYDLDALVGSLQERLGDVPLVGGTTTTGVLSSAGWTTGEKGAAALLLVTGRPAGVGVAPKAPDPVAAGRAAAEAALAQAGGSAAAILTIPAMGDEESLLAGIAQVAPGVPIVGGSTSEHGPGGAQRQFANGKVYADSFAVAALGGKEIGYALQHGYKPTGKKAVVTKAEGRRVITLDNRPALDVYCEWTGTAKEELEGPSPMAGIQALQWIGTKYPLVIHKPAGTLAADPVNSNEDGSINTGVAWEEGWTVELMENTLDGILGEVANAVRAAAGGVEHPSALFLVQCDGRALPLRDRIGEVADQVKLAVGDIPWLGILAWGEQGCMAPGVTAHANLSISALVLGEE